MNEKPLTPQELVTPETIDPYLREFLLLYLSLNPSFLMTQIEYWSATQSEGLCTEVRTAIITVTFTVHDALPDAS